MIAPFRASGKPGKGGLDKVQERFDANNTGLTL
jgi:hypothetical protein